MSTLARSPVADCHNDLLLELDHYASEENPFATRWLPKLTAGGVRLQVCPVFVDLAWMPELALRRALQQVNAFHRAVATNDREVFSIRTSDDVEALDATSRTALLLAMEGAEPLGNSPDLLDIFEALGVRMISLTWNRRNAFADGVGESANSGLSRLGRMLVDRIVELGIILDLAHASERTFWEALERAGGSPVMVSHAACKSIHDTARNLSDEQLEALAASGGVLGVMQLPMAIGPGRPVIDRVVDHIDRAVQVMGVEHVGLGGDFIAQLRTNVPMQIPGDSFHPKGAPPTSSIEGLCGPEDYPNLARALEQRGYDEKSRHSILGRNVIDFFGKSLSRQPTSRARR